MKKGFLMDVQFHSKGKEMALMGFYWDGMWQDQMFLFYKDHLAIVWRLEKMGVEIWG